MPVARLVTTSWDDGNISDLRIAELLVNRGLPGTFYIPLSPFKDLPSLNHSDLRDLCSAGFEIGAHGLSHTLLPRLSPSELSREVTECKAALENAVGRKVGMFCYPRGRYDGAVIRSVKQAGYRGARTTRMLATSLGFSDFEMPTTLQVFEHTRSAYFRNILKSRNLPGFFMYVTQGKASRSWVELGKRLFDSVRKHGGVWHLYGHSWEVEKFGLWEGLRELLDYVRGREGVTYGSNFATIEFLSRHREFRQS